MDGQRERLGGRQAVAEPAVDQQRPHVAEGDLPVDQILDVDAAVPQRAAVLVGFGDLGGEGHDAFEPLDEVFRYAQSWADSCTRVAGSVYRSVTSRRTRRSVALSRGNIVTTRHLARMRVEYGSVEKDGSPDLDADWLADGWVALLRKWLADAEDARRRRAQRDGGRHGRRAGKARHPHRVVQERGRNRASPSTPTTTPPRASSWPPTRTRRRRSRGSCSAARSTCAAR